MEIEKSVIAYLIILMLVYAGITDLRNRKIYNVVPAALLILYIIVALVTPFAYFTWQALVAAVSVLLVGMVFSALNWMAPGDVKLLFSLSVWVGWPTVLDFLIVVCYAGGALALVWLYIRHYASITGNVVLRNWASELPYGVAIALAGILYVLMGLYP